MKHKLKLSCQYIINFSELLELVHFDQGASHGKSHQIISIVLLLPLNTGFIMINFVANHIACCRWYLTPYWLLYAAGASHAIGPHHEILSRKPLPDLNFV